MKARCGHWGLSSQVDSWIHIAYFWVQWIYGPKNILWPKLRCPKMIWSHWQTSESSDEFQPEFSDWNLCWQLYLVLRNKLVLCTILKDITIIYWNLWCKKICLVFTSYGLCNKHALCTILRDLDADIRIMILQLFAGIYDERKSVKFSQAMLTVLGW